jgi:hypothetical protein
MKDSTGVAGYFAAGAVTGVALYGIYAKFSSKANDDDPIIVAGGSMRIHTHSKDKFTPDGEGGLKHVDGKNRSVTGVDILYNDTGPDGVSRFFKNQLVTVTLTYCDTLAACAYSEDVTLSTDLNGTSLGITNGPKTIGGEVVPNSDHFDHLPNLPNWKISNIALNGKNFKCSDGRCYVVIHYK